jgi:hypothetical protein
MRTAMADALASVTKWWKSLKRHVYREERVKQQDIERARKLQQEKELSIKEAAYQVMAAAYNLASDYGRLPANARQVMYAARPLVLQLLDGRPCWKHSSYFTQHLLMDFIEESPSLTQNWDVVFDDRGHFEEPHTGMMIGLGTLKVRAYISGWDGRRKEEEDNLPALAHDYPTSGPRGRYKYALFVEKEGFNSLLEAAEIAERYDLAIMSTKGMSVTAARNLVEHLTTEGVTILVLHDFDKSGFSILHTLQSDTRRFQYTHTPNVIDLGLRLADVEAMQLESEPVEYGRGVDPRENLRQSGATEEECDFLVNSDTGDGWSGKRVELNAMTSPQLLEWLEAKLAEEGVEKVIPDQETLQKAFARAHKVKTAEEAMANADDGGPLPDDLAQQIREKQMKDPTLSWDEALWQIVQGD